MHEINLFLQYENENISWSKSMSSLQLTLKWSEPCAWLQCSDPSQVISQWTETLLLRLIVMFSTCNQSKHACQSNPTIKCQIAILSDKSDVALILLGYWYGHSHAVLVRVQNPVSHSYTCYIYYTKIIRKQIDTSTKGFLMGFKGSYLH